MKEFVFRGYKLEGFGLGLGLRVEGWADWGLGPGLRLGLRDRCKCCVAYSVMSCWFVVCLVFVLCMVLCCVALGSCCVASWLCRGCVAVALRCVVCGIEHYCYVTGHTSAKRDSMDNVERRSAASV
jgi:hypothetical protein